MAVAPQVAARVGSPALGRDSLSSLASFSSSASWLSFESSSARFISGRVGGNGQRRRGLKMCCERAVTGKAETMKQGGRGDGAQLSIVMKFGGSSVASAARMREVADLILRYPEERPVIVLSAMEKTTNKLLTAGETAVSCGVTHVSELEELSFIKELHLKTVDELGVGRDTVSVLLDKLEQLLKDDFTNVDILEATYPAIAKRLHGGLKPIRDEDLSPACK